MRWRDTHVPLRLRPPGVVEPPCPLPTLLRAALVFWGLARGPLGTGTGSSSQCGHTEGLAGGSGSARLLLPLAGLFWGATWQGAGGWRGVGVTLPTRAEREEGAADTGRPAP